LFDSKVFEKKKKRKATEGEGGPNEEIIKQRKLEEEDTANHG